MPPPAHIDTHPSESWRRCSSFTMVTIIRAAGARDRVAEARTAAVDVHDLLVDPELARRGDGHRAERLVDLPELDVADRHPDAVERLRDRERRRESRARRLDADRRPRHHTASGCNPFARAYSLDVTTTAAAPSLSPAAFPAVTVAPSISGCSTGSAARDSIDELRRGCSSTSNSRELPSGSVTGTGTISFSNAPSSMERSAFSVL